MPFWLNFYSSTYLNKLCKVQILRKPFSISSMSCRISTRLPSISKESYNSTEISNNKNHPSNHKSFLYQSLFRISSPRSPKRDEGGITKRRKKFYNQRKESHLKRWVWWICLWRNSQKNKGSCSTLSTKKVTAHLFSTDMLKDRCFRQL